MVKIACILFIVPALSARRGQSISSRESYPHVALLQTVLAQVQVHPPRC